MDEFRAKFLFKKLVFGVLLFVFTVLVIVFLSLGNYERMGLLLAGIIIFCLDIIPLLLFICTFSLSCRKYEYNGVSILVYVGFTHHYLSVDGNIVDRYDASICFVPIVLTTKLNDGTDIKATISLSNAVVLKINEKLCEATEIVGYKR